MGALIALCRTRNETPAGKLEAALAPMLDIDGALLKFLAIEVALVNTTATGPAPAITASIVK